MLFVKGKDKSMESCIAFRKINTIRNKYPLPGIDDILDQLNWARVFSKIDLGLKYHRLRVADKNILKTSLGFVLSLRV